MLRHLARPLMAVAVVVALTLAGRPAAQAAGIALIRDAEMEATLREMTNPILEAAGLGADSVRIYVVDDDTLNAFVAGGMNLFINTGLIMRSETPDQLLGVIAHEVGHIAGGHLTRVVTAQQRAAAEMIVATVLGAASALAGAPQLGTAIIGGGQTLAQSGLLKFSRSQEQSADQAALTYLDQIDVSAEGLAEFFHILDNQSALAVSRPDPWLQTHPLTRDRISFVEGHVAREPEGRSAPPAWREAHARMVAKLRGFLSPPRDVLRRYEQDDSVAGRYGRAIALYRLPDLNGALAAIRSLIQDYPDDPYFHEVEGQILFENGRVADSIGPYRAAVRLRPGSSLLDIGLAQSLIELNTDDANREAMGHLQEALGREPTNAAAWRLLGIAQGRAGLEGQSFLSFAEYALLIGKRDDAELYVARAESRMNGSDPGWLRLQDIKRVLDSE